MSQDKDQIFTAIKQNSKYCMLLYFAILFDKFKKQMILQQNIQSQAQSSIKKPSNLTTQSLQKIQNNRYLNQNIYNLFTMGRYKQCMQLIQKCKPDEYKLYMKSLIYKHQFKLDKSLVLLNQCQVMNKLNFLYLKNIAKNFYLLGKYKSSLEVAKQAYRLNVADYQIFYIIAKASVAIKDVDSAISNLNRAIAKQPNEQSYIFLAQLLIEKGNYRQAADQLRKALIISPENDQIYQMLGQIENKQGHREDALRYHNSALQINPYKYQSLFSIAAIKQANNQIDSALQIYTKAYKISQNSALFWNNLAIIMAKKNKDIAAYCCFKKALFLDPFRYDIHTNLAIILLKVKKYVGAQLHLRSALKLNKSPQIYNLLGICLTQLNDYSNAQKCFQQILKNSENKIDLSETIKYKINYLCLVAKKGNKQKCKQIVSQINNISMIPQYRQKIREISGLL